MARTAALTREEVNATIEAWRDGAIADREMRLWAMKNYFPLHQEVAPGEAAHVALAIGRVLTELECAPETCPLNRVVAHAALSYINSSSTEGVANEAAFYREVRAVRSNPTFQRTATPPLN